MYTKYGIKYEVILNSISPNPSHIRFDNSILLSTRKSQSIFDWLFAFPEALKVYFQKQMEM
jgi:hypothetical protein